MRRMAVILLIAALLVLALSVPALAGPSDPPNFNGFSRSDWNAEYDSPWGQTVKILKGMYADLDLTWGDVTSQAHH